MKFDVVVRFHETIPTVKFGSSSEIKKNFGFLPKLQFYPFAENLNFPGFYILSSLKGISSRNSVQSQKFTCICNVHYTMHAN